MFSGVQNGPVALPLTGLATYDLIGSTSPTDSLGNVGTLNSASLAANFSVRTVDLGVNLTIAGQNIVGSALSVPIYRDQYFSAFRGVVPCRASGAAAAQHFLPAGLLEPHGIGRRFLRRANGAGGGDDVQPERRLRRGGVPPQRRLSAVARMNR